MNTFACERAGVLMERRAAGLSPADRLRLEEHLGACTNCHDTARGLAAISRLWHAGEATLDVEARRRAIAAALESRERDFYRTPGWSLRRRSVPLAIAAAAAAAMLLVYWQGGDAARAPSASRIASERLHERDSVVLEGSVHTGEGQRLLPGRALSDRGTLHAPQGARVSLAGAVLTLGGGARARYDRDARSLRLDEGEIVARLPERAQPLTVRTEAFQVVALGARFEMSADAVRVYRGQVRVLSPGGRVLSPALAAGQSWSAAEEPSARAPANAAQRKPTAPEASPGGELLRRARAQLADGDVARAKRSVRAALRAALPARLRAEALSLRAECALVAGDEAEAATLYLRVAERYRSSPAGDNALFAAARIEADRGRLARAARLLRRYLARYPRGRFRNEARTRLSQLPSTDD